MCVSESTAISIRTSSPTPRHGRASRYHWGVRRRLAILAAAVLAALGAGAAPARAMGPAPPDPVPSLTPAATERLWQQLVAARSAAPAAAPSAARAQAGCVPVRAIFYAATDWMRLATRLALNPAPCVEYFISVPPLADAKAQPRVDQAWRIRALGPQFHALAEISVNGWTAYVNETGSTWYDAGVEARRRIDAAGYDVALGDTWALNELSSAVRQNVGSARQNMRAFLDGLHDGDGILPQARGVVWVVGIGQGTADLSVYKSRLQEWYADTAFWTAMSRDVGDWMQETFGDVRRYAVPGAPPEARRDALNEYLQHPAALAAAAPASVAQTKAFVADRYGPLAGAAWRWQMDFGYTDVPVELMQDYVSAQVYAARSAGNARFGFSWQPVNLAGLPTGEFAAQTTALADRVAAAIAGSGEAPAGACAPDWCTRGLDGATFTTAWRTFSTWSGAPPPDTTPPETTITSGPPGTVRSASAGFAFSADEPGSGFECSLDGETFAACTTGVGYTGLALGLHRFEVRAVDPAGNVDATPAVHEWTAEPEPERPLPAPPGPAARPSVPSFAPPAAPRVPPP
jgi:hypothetical protein